MAKSDACRAASQAVAALACFLAWHFGDFRWGVTVLAISGGLVCGGGFARLIAREPPSRERFQRLCVYGMLCVGGLVAGVALVATRLLGGSDPILVSWVLVATLLGLMLGAFVFVIWTCVECYDYSAKPSDPDFQEDMEGNPIRCDENGRDETA
jgi:hypothetical protein